MKHQRSHFYKGLSNFSVTSDDGLLEAAEASIYKHWWSFMRLSPVYWYALTTGIAPVVSEIAENYEKAANLNLISFNIWWNKHGKFVFEEAKKPAELKLINLDEPNEYKLYQNSILIEIPLTATSKKIIREQIRSRIDRVIRVLYHSLLQHRLEDHLL